VKGEGEHGCEGEPNVKALKMKAKMKNATKSIHDYVRPIRMYQCGIIPRRVLYRSVRI
jgi:hypothetical protein